MREAEGGVEVTISGAVRRQGSRCIPLPATVAGALVAAGWLAHSRRRWTSGIVTIRRPRGGKDDEEWRYDISTQPISEWGRFLLRSGDCVIFHWHMEDV